MGKQRNTGTHITDEIAFEGDWGDMLQIESLETVVCRGVGGGFYHLYIGGEVTAGTYSITRKRGSAPLFYDLKTDDFELSGNQLTILNSGTIASTITIVLRD